MATTVDIGSLIHRRPDLRGGRPCIGGTGVCVRTIVVYHKMGFCPEEIIFKRPDLSLAQVHASLAYYYANQAEIDSDIEAEEKFAEEMAKQFPPRRP